MIGSPGFSIVGRLTALVVAVGVLTLLLNAAVTTIFLPRLVDELAIATGRQFAIVRMLLADAPDERRSELARGFARAGIRVSIDPPVVNGDARNAPQMPLPMLERLQNALGKDMRLMVSEGPPGAGVQLHAGFRLDGREWWVTIEGARPPSTSPLTPLLLALAIVGAAGALAGVFGIRLITRPMSALAQQMHDRRSSLRPIDEPPGTGVELRELIQSFNGLVHAVNDANEVRHNMLVGLSHDLRTPLARLRLRAEIELPEPTMQSMEGDFAALAKIIDQFLAYAQGEAGVPLGSPELLGEVVAHAVQRWPAPSVQFRPPPPALAELRLPDLAIHRIVGNLVDNALAHGVAPVEVAIEADEAVNGAHCRLMVYDRGQGIAPTQLAHALEPFVKLHADRAELGHCGLGLAIVAQLARQLGGRVVMHPHDGRRFGLGVALPVRGHEPVP